MRDLSDGRLVSWAAALCSILATVTPAGAQTPAPPSAPAATAIPAPPPAPPAAAPAAAPPPGAYYPPPPGYAYPPAPGYAYPPPPYGTYARPVRAPDSWPYDGGPVPAGFHVEERPRRGLVIAGSLVLGIPWAVGLSIASGSDFSNRSGWLAVPALGPWITLASRRSSYCTNDLGSFSTCYDDGTNSASRTFLVLDGLMQASGTVLLVVGLASKNKVIARDFVGNLHFTPAPVGAHGYGGFVTGQF